MLVLIVLVLVASFVSPFREHSYVYAPNLSPLLGSLSDLPP